MNTGDMLKCCVISDEIVRQYEDLCRKNGKACGQERLTHIYRRFIFL